MNNIQTPLDSEIFLQALDGARTCIWVWKIDYGELIWSDNVDEVFDFEVGTFPRRADAFHQLIHPDDREAVIGAIKRSFHDGQSHGSRYRLLHPNGRVFWLESRGRATLDAQGHAQTMTGMIVDNSDLHRIEEALEASKAKYTAAFLSSPDAIVIAHIADKKIVEVNDGFARITGYSRQEAIGRSGDDLGLWTAPKDRSNLLQALERKGHIHDIEWSFRDRFEKERYCLVSASIIDVTGEPHLLLVIRDIGERKRSEEERGALIDELQRKAAELERFAYTVSHDLKSPLVTIRGFLGMLEKDLQTQRPDRVSDDLERIRNATRTMQRLLDDLLELSRAGKAHHTLEMVSLEDLTHHAMDQVAGRLHEAQVQVHIANDLPKVLGDYGQLMQVLQNLIDNAVKFMGSQEQPRIDIGVRLEADEKICFVRDNGCGIAPQHQQKIFDLFQRLRPDIDGTGIGLALVKRIIEAHDGRIWVESEGEGLGTTFCWVLPDPALLKSSLSTQHGTPDT